MTEILQSPEVIKLLNEFIGNSATIMETSFV
jgi:hypothetical protein